jgi:hypothetical protein
MVEGVIKEADVKSCTVQNFEIGVQKLYTAVEVGELPFSIDDASRPESDFQRVSRPCSVSLPKLISRWRPRTFNSLESACLPDSTTVSWTSE